MQGCHLKPVAAEIRRLHFTLPPATFYVSRIKKCVIYSQSRYRDNDHGFFSLPITYYRHLSIVNNASQTDRRVAVFHWPTKVWYPCWHVWLEQILYTDQNVETKIEFPRSEFHCQTLSVQLSDDIN